MDLFGVPWDQIEFAEVASFLSGATDEGVTWEAKGDDERGAWHPRGVRKAVCAFANSFLGGYIIVGAVFGTRSVGRGHCLDSGSRRLSH